jgi:hypothetical protein
MPDSHLKYGFPVRGLAVVLTVLAAADILFLLGWALAYVIAGWQPHVHSQDGLAFLCSEGAVVLVGGAAASWVIAHD